MIKVLFAILVLTLSSVTFRATPKRLPFIDDDFLRALADAKQRNVPLFVEVWAPW